ncbi:MAG TPA: c-type cytochrome [Candidatus Acidoferrales bacterium]
MNSRRGALAAAFFSSLLLGACASAPGRPLPGDIPPTPSEVSDFSVLYSQNCAGCHGSQGKGGAALALADPVYLAIANDSVIRNAAANGISGTSMPAFAQSAGGMLTEKQIDAIVGGIRTNWSKPNALQGVAAPPYAASTPGDSARGGQAYVQFCSSCHGAAGRGGAKASSIVDSSFLALLNDQELRTLVIVGRPELGAPDWRNNVPGHAMSPQEISDVVAWLAAQRTKFPGQPFPSPTNATGEIR